MIREDGTVLFTPDKCDDCFHMAQGWEGEFDYNKIHAPYMNNYKNTETQTLRLVKGRFFFEFNERLIKNPRREKLKDWRKHRGKRAFWKKELPKVTKKVQRKFKTKMKKNLYNETYYHPVPHDYKTYGWESW